MGYVKEFPQIHEQTSPATKSGLLTVRTSLRLLTLYGMAAVLFGPSPRRMPIPLIVPECPARIRHVSRGPALRR
jgi:hypothetical protein